MKRANSGLRNDEIQQLQNQYLERQRKWEEKSRMEQEMQKINQQFDFRQVLDQLQPKKPGRPAKETEATWNRPEIDYDFPDLLNDGKGAFQIFKKE